MTAYEPLDPHVDVGAYVLGVLDDPDMDRFEQHLAVCATCNAQLDELSTLVPVLAELGRAGVPEPPDTGMLDRLLAEVSQQRRTRHRRRWLYAVAASVLIVGGPTAAVLVTYEGRPPAVTQAAPQIVRTAFDPHTGVHATVGMTAKSWGTQIDLKLTDVDGPRTCKLVAVGKDGRTETVANWTVPDTGYGRTAQVKPLNLAGATAMSPSGIARFDVVTSTGQQLVSVPA